jgi:hypothetical protein
LTDAVMEGLIYRHNPVTLALYILTLVVINCMLTLEVALEKAEAKTNEWSLQCEEHERERRRVQEELKAVQAKLIEVQVSLDSSTKAGFEYENALQQAMQNLRGVERRAEEDRRRALQQHEFEVSALKGELLSRDDRMRVITHQYQEELNAAHAAKAQELDEVSRRVKQTIAKKDEAIQLLRTQLQRTEREALQIESLLESQQYGSNLVKTADSLKFAMN